MGRKNTKNLHPKYPAIQRTIEIKFKTDFISYIICLSGWFIKVLSHLQSINLPIYCPGIFLESFENFFLKNKLYNMQYSF